MDPTTFVDQRYGPRPFRLCAANIVDFVDVTRDDPTRWDQFAPPGFVAAALFAVAPDLLSRLADRSVLHGEQVFSWLRPLRTESVLQVTGTVTRVRERGGVHFVGFEVELNDGEDPVAMGTSMFLVSPQATVDSVTERVEPPPAEDGDPGVAQVGASRADLIRYAAATRDWNPIHWDHDSAVRAGQPGVLVHGLLQAAWAFKAAASLRGGARPLRAARVRFRNPLPAAVSADLHVEEGDGVATVGIVRGDTEFISARVEFSDE